jgi:hypothetical protein
MLWNCSKSGIQDAQLQYGKGITAIDTQHCQHW